MNKPELKEKLQLIKEYKALLEKEFYRLKESRKADPDYISDFWLKIDPMWLEHWSFQLGQVSNWAQPEDIKFSMDDYPFPTKIDIQIRYRTPFTKTKFETTIEL